MSLHEIMERDMDILFRPEDFGEEVVYTPSGGAAVTIYAHFDQAYEAVDSGSQAVVMSTQPKLTVPTSWLPDAADQDDLVRVRGRNYRVVELQPDGAGLVDVLLHEEA